MTFVELMVLLIALLLILGLILFFRFIDVQQEENRNDAHKNQILYNMHKDLEKIRKKL